MGRRNILKFIWGCEDDPHVTLRLSLEELDLVIGGLRHWLRSIAILSFEDEVLKADLEALIKKLEGVYNKHVSKKGRA